MDEYNGDDVLDAAGDKIGTVERTYVDDRGVAHMVEVKMGSLFGKHRLIPLEGAQESKGALQFPFSKGTVEASPDASDASDTVGEDLIDQVQSFYDGQAAAVVPGDGTGSSPNGGDGSNT